MNDLNKKTLETLNAIDAMCEVLMKAAAPASPRSIVNQISASPYAPDVTDEQVIAARGSELPLSHPDMTEEGPAQPEGVGLSPAETPQLDSGVREDIVSQYTPERLHAVVQHASKAIAEALMHSLVAHQKAQRGDTLKLPKGGSDEGESVDPRQ